MTDYMTGGSPDPTQDRGAKDIAGDVSGAAQEQTAAVAGAAKDQLTDVAASAKEQAAAVADTAGEQVRNLLGEAQEELTSQASAQKEKAVTGLRALSKDLASMAEQNNDGGIARHAVDEAGKRTASLADYLDNREPGQLLDDLRDLGRRRTGGFLLGAAVLGFAGGRLLKGSRADTDEVTEEPATPVRAVATPPVSLHESPMQDDDPTTLPGTYGALISTPSLMSADDV